MGNSPTTEPSVSTFSIPSSSSIYWRHYPKEVHQRRTKTHLGFFRTISLQINDLTSDDHNSPARKKPRILLKNARNFVSLPEFRPPDLNTSLLKNRLLNDLINVELSRKTSNEMDVDDGRKNIKSDSLYKSLFFDCKMQQGPIIEQVLSRGLTAKLHNAFSWMLNDRANVDQKFALLTSKFRHSFNRRLAHSASRKRRLEIPSSASSSQAGDSTTGSLYSLNDGRTPWPTPWLEAIFLPEYPNKAPINEKCFSIIGTIARGAFGKVHRVCLTSKPGNVFAMKVQIKSEIIDKQAIQQIKDEVTIHESLGKGTFIANFYASWQSRSKVYTVLQYVMGYGDLHLLWRDYGPFNDEVVRIYAAEIGTALDFIHSNGVIYRDLKLENIVLDENGHVQLVDFGLAKWLDGDDRTSTICGTLQYMAPDVASELSYGRAVDWWSLGVILHVLLTSKFPFPNAKVLDHRHLRFIDYDTPEHCDQVIQSLLERLLALEADQRIQTLDQLKSHSCFSSFNFDAICERKMRPFDFISGMQRCGSCNSLFDKNGEASDCEENLMAFEEQYEFADFDYFNDDEQTMTVTDK